MLLGLIVKILGYGIGKMKDLNYSDFYLGKLGCDNRIAWEFKK